MMDTPAITGDAVAHIGSTSTASPRLCSAFSLKHLDHVVQQFQREGFKAASVDGNMEMSERSRRLEDLKKGQLNILASCQLLTEGVDTPACQGVDRPARPRSRYALPPDRPVTNHAETGA